jgi:hypothetical protein
MPLTLVRRFCRTTKNFHIPGRRKNGSMKAKLEAIQVLTSSMNGSRRLAVENFSTLISKNSRKRQVSFVILSPKK